jgi:hypothetical protein
VLLRVLLSYMYNKRVENQENVPAIERTIIMLGGIRVGSFPSIWDRSRFDHDGCLRGCVTRLQASNDGEPMREFVWYSYGDG